MGFGWTGSCLLPRSPILPPLPAIALPPKLPSHYLSPLASRPIRTA